MHIIRDSCIQKFHLGMYILGYTVGKFVLRGCVSGAVKHKFRNVYMMKIPL